MDVCVHTKQNSTLKTRITLLTMFLNLFQVICFTFHFIIFIKHINLIAANYKPWDYLGFYWLQMIETQARHGSYGIYWLTEQTIGLRAREQKTCDPLSCLSLSLSHRQACSRAPGFKYVLYFHCITSIYQDLVLVYFSVSGRITLIWSILIKI